MRVAAAVEEVALGRPMLAFHTGVLASHTSALDGEAALLEG